MKVKFERSRSEFYESGLGKGPKYMNLKEFGQQYTLEFGVLVPFKIKGLGSRGGPLWGLKKLRGIQHK